jgi:hypothetical protein
VKLCVILARLFNVDVENEQQISKLSEKNMSVSQLTLCLYGPPCAGKEGYLRPDFPITELWHFPAGGQSNGNEMFVLPPAASRAIALFLYLSLSLPLPPRSLPLAASAASGITNTSCFGG